MMREGLAYIEYRFITGAQAKKIFNFALLDHKILSFKGKELPFPLTGGGKRQSPSSPKPSHFQKNQKTKSRKMRFLY